MPHPLAAASLRSVRLHVASSSRIVSGLTGRLDSLIFSGSVFRKGVSAQQIVAVLRQADVALGKGEKVPDVCKQLGISEQTYYRWRTKYGGMDPQMARQLQELQKENARLKRLVADQALDNQILREAARPNW